MRGEYIRRADAMGKITSSETQKALRTMTGEEVYVTVVGILNELPAADVAPVVHGWWNADETCSVCGEKSTEGLDATKWNYWFPNYCPNCGAKMDGGADHAAD